MGNSYRITIRFNPEYDKEIINKLQQYKDRNLSKILRKIIRENLENCNNCNLAAPLSDIPADINYTPELQTKQDKVIKWNIPMQRR